MDAFFFIGANDFIKLLTNARLKGQFKIFDALTKKVDGYFCFGDILDLKLLKFSKNKFQKLFKKTKVFLVAFSIQSCLTKVVEC